MSLGVLNNISATYAENNLNNSNNSLTTVLQQLSSGSKINSGADDAAGLSLVDGLQANQTALTQSVTNAKEGVGLLQVADGALSQVTSLLNRAVTLATEASNGTLNASQDTAANQEFQSILSETSNIGTTTTYNDSAVFGTNTSIYTGDSSTTGSSIDDLNIRSLSSSNVGDSGGQMAYSTGSSGNNVFIDLSNSTSLSNPVAAGINDHLNSAGTTSITITTLSNTGTDVANVVTVGGTSGYDNTAQGMISAINSQSQSQGWGVTASFTTAAVAGDTASGTAATDTGIMITGSVGSGTSPSQSSSSGVVAAAGNTVTALTAMTGGLTGVAADAVKAGSDIMSGSLTLQVGNNAASIVTAAQVATANGEASGAVTMTQLASYITANGNLGVTASVDSTTGALDLSTSGGSTAALKVTSNLTDNTLKTTTAGNETTSYTATSAYSAGISTASIANGGITDSNIGNETIGTPTAIVAGTETPVAGTANAAGKNVASVAAGTALAGTLTLTDALGNHETLQLGVASAGTDTLQHLAATINTLGTTGGTGGASLGYAAAIDNAGNLDITQTTYAGAANKITASTAATAWTPNGGAPAANVAGSIGSIASTDSLLEGLSGTISIVDGLGKSHTLQLGSALAGTDTVAHLAATLNTLGTTGGVGGTSLGFTAQDNAGAMEIDQVVSTTGTPFTAVTASTTAAGAAALAQTGTTDAVTTGGASTSGGTATISYTDEAGISLSGTDLSNQTDAQNALGALNKAITAVAAQDGYIGAQINTLNAVSQVISTQQENVQSAQNAVQATDYASATSNMSKYEILSQTGISALAQANSVQQEVTKLLQ